VTEELARKLISDGIMNPRLYTTMKQMYEQYTGEEIANTIAYIRAEITLGHWSARDAIEPDPPLVARTRRTTKLVLDDK